MVGFQAIAAHVGGAEPLTPAQQADQTAYSAFLPAHAGPLVALSLYVSSANWAATTRPAYSALLPFPLTWTEPPALREQMARRAAHLGLSSLDTDADPAAAAADPAQSEHGLFAIPERLRPRPRRGVADALTPEQKARIRLEEEAVSCLSVLAELQAGGKEKWLLRPDGPTALDCLAYGYLALMLVPDVPRAWLREVMTAKYAGLCAFVAHVRTDVFQGAKIPWAEPASLSAADVGVRFVRGALASIPVVGGELDRWLVARRREERQDDVSSGMALVRRTSRRADWLLALGAALGGAAVVAGVAWYRSLPPFGSPLYRYQRSRPGLLGIGPLGGLLDLSVDLVPGFPGTSQRGGHGTVEPVVSDIDMRRTRDTEAVWMDDKEPGWDGWGKSGPNNNTFP